MLNKRTCSHKIVSCKFPLLSTLVSPLISLLSALIGLTVTVLFSVLVSVSCSFSSSTFLLLLSFVQSQNCFFSLVSQTVSDYLRIVNVYKRFSLYIENCLNVSVFPTIHYKGKLHTSQLHISQPIGHITLHIKYKQGIL